MAALSGTWTEGSSVYPSGFDTIGTYNGAVVCTDPESAGDTYHGIGCAWRDVGSLRATVCVEWSGTYATNGTDPHVEAAPLLHVTPGTIQHAFGVWTSFLDLGFGPFPCLFAGTIGNPGSEFGVIDVAAFTHTPGTPRVVTAESDGRGFARCWLDGTAVEFSTHGPRVPIPEPLRSSTIHGFAIDAHYTPLASVPTAKGIESVRIHVPNRVTTFG